MILLIDNYDSFAHNLARYLRQLGQPLMVERNDQLTLDDVTAMRPSGLVISPGPCRPDDSGVCLQLVRRFSAHIPILGICLGHQAICQAHGGEIDVSQPVHGRISQIFHHNHPLFAGIGSPFSAARYHSLIAKRESLPPELQVIAESSDGLVMAVAHRHVPVVGLQFHPESILTQHGYRLLANFLEFAGLSYHPAQPMTLDRDIHQQRNFVQQELTTASLSDTAQH